VPDPTRAIAEQADRDDPLRAVRDRFVVPDKLIYLDGNSLGAMPTTVRPAIEDALTRQWGSDLIRSWNGNGWWTLPARTGDRIGRLVGAAPGQVMCGDSTSVQVFQALVALARRNGDRHTLITDAGGFPTDQYLAESAARMRFSSTLSPPGERRRVHEDRSPARGENSGTLCRMH